MNFALQLKNIPFAKCPPPPPPPPPQSMLIILSEIIVVSSLVNMVQGGWGDVLPGIGILENSPKTVKCVISFATDCGSVSYFLPSGTICQTSP